MLFKSKNEKEKLEILNDLESGKIDIEQAEELLKNIKDTNYEVMPKPNNLKKKRYIHVDIVSADGDVVKVNIPLTLAKFGLKMSQSSQFDALDKYNINLEELLNELEDDFEGILVDINSADGDVVKIYID